MGRPKKAEALAEVLQIRVSPALVRKIDQSRGDMTRSDWCRQAILRSCLHVRAGIAEEVTKERDLDLVTEPHRHRRGEERTRALGNMKASYWCATPGCTEILHGG